MAISEPSWLRVHRAVRALPDGEGPFRGLLVADHDATVVAVPLTELDGWEGWPHAGATHIAAPLDIALLDSGFHALLPWCTIELSALLAGRRLADDALGSGEVVTLVISVLRGMAELGESVAQARGCWWLTPEGRPVLVLGEGRDVGEGARALFAELAASVTDRRLSRLLTQLHDAAERPRGLVREIARWESELLECAAPQALRVDVRTAAPAQRHLRAGAPFVRVAPSGAATAIRAARDDHLERGHDRRVSERLREQLDRLRAGVSRAIAAYRRPDTEPHRRRHKLVVAAVAAGLVLLGGFLWPTSSGEAGTEGSGTVPAQAADDPFEVLPRPPSSEDVASSAPPITDPLAAFAHIVESAHRCLAEEDDECAVVLLDTSDVTAGLLIGLVSAAPEVSLADDFGDIAVVRLADGDSKEYVVVLARHAQQWFLRDVYDLGRP